MKKFLILALMAITSYGVNAQPPHVRHQEKPKVEHKDGKVIITMSEVQFRHMQQMRSHQRPGFHPVAMRQQVCVRCEHKHKRHPRRHR